MLLGVGLAGEVLSIVSARQGVIGLYPAVQLGLMFGTGIAQAGALISFASGNEKER